jgi:hypothetical protein
MNRQHIIGFGLCLFLLLMVSIVPTSTLAKPIESMHQDAQRLKSTSSFTDDSGSFWGPIFYARCTPGFRWYSFNNTYLQIPTFEYKAAGFGNHLINYTLTYNFTYYNGTWDNATYQGCDAMYVTLRPMLFLAILLNHGKPMKLVAKDFFEFPQQNLARGSSWSVAMTIDNGKYSGVSTYRL